MRKYQRRNSVPESPRNNRTLPLLESEENIFPARNLFMIVNRQDLFQQKATNKMEREIKCRNTNAEIRFLKYIFFR